MGCCNGGYIGDLVSSKLSYKTPLEAFTTLGFQGKSAGAVVEEQEPELGQAVSYTAAVLLLRGQVSARMLLCDDVTLAS